MTFTADRGCQLAPISTGRQIAGVEIARQVVIGTFIADFAARAAKRVIEVDGDTHTDQARDKYRTAWFQQQGYRVIRFSNADVMNNADGVRQIVVAALEAPPHPDPLPGGEKRHRSMPS